MVKIMAAVAALSLLLAGSILVEPVDFRDAALASAVRSALEISRRPLTRLDLLRLTDLKADGLGIVWLDGWRRARIYGQSISPRTGSLIWSPWRSCLIWKAWCCEAIW